MTYDIWKIYGISTYFIAELLNLHPAGWTGHGKDQQYEFHKPVGKLISGGFFAEVG